MTYRIGNRGRVSRSTLLVIRRNESYLRFSRVQLLSGVVVTDAGAGMNQLLGDSAVIRCIAWVGYTMNNKKQILVLKYAKSALKFSLV